MSKRTVAQKARNLPTARSARPNNTVDSRLHTLSQRPREKPRVGWGIVGGYPDGTDAERFCSSELAKAYSRMSLASIRSSLVRSIFDDQKANIVGSARVNVLVLGWLHTQWLATKGARPDKL